MIPEELHAWGEAVIQSFNAWAERFIADMQPVLAALAKSLPKQPVVNRRKLAARRARRRNEKRDLLRAKR